jgi:hypothetical protein
MNILKNKLDGAASIDEILIWLWRIHQEIYKRQRIIDQINKLIHEELLERVPGVRGVHQITDH